MTNESFPLAQAALRHPHQCAYSDAKMRVSYEQLARDVAAQTAGLIGSGLRSNERVAWCPRNDYQTLVNLWSILQAGAVACPISARVPVAKQRGIAKQIRARWLDSFQTTRMDTAQREIDLASPATIVLSSGSTGVPKAVVHSLNAHLASARGAAMRIPLAHGDGWLWSLPANHVGGLSIPFRCAVAGATVCGVNDTDVNLDQLVRDSGATHISLVPTQLRRLLNSQADLSGIKAALVGGMEVPPPLIRLAIDRGVPIHTTYGLTEMASQVTTSQVCRSLDSTSGETLSYREVRIGAHDEILVRGETLCLGYDVAGEIVRATDEEGWFHTRDRGRLTSHGSLVVLGRLDNMFISGGENVHPETIERELLGFVDIRQAIVVPRNDTEFGARPVAFIDADVMDTERWSGMLRERLAGFEIPAEYMDWPAQAELAIKPDRSALRRIANSQH